MIDRIFSSQQKALDEVRNVSEELYQAAIQVWTYIHFKITNLNFYGNNLQIDQTILPFNAKGPVATPAVKDYDSPDGDYNDISKKWD